MRFNGFIGYATTGNTGPGVFEEVITEYSYTGDVVRNTRHLDQVSAVPPMVNAGISLQNSFSILASADAFDDFSKIRYVKWRDQAWRVTDVEVRPPRLILTVGGLWDGDKN